MKIYRVYINKENELIGTSIRYIKTLRDYHLVKIKSLLKYFKNIKIISYIEDPKTGELKYLKQININFQNINFYFNNKGLLTYALKKRGTLIYENIDKIKVGLSLLDNKNKIVNIIKKEIIYSINNELTIKLELSNKDKLVIDYMNSSYTPNITKYYFID